MLSRTIWDFQDFLRGKAKNNNTIDGERTYHLIITTFSPFTAYKPWLSSGDDKVNDNDEGKDTDKDKYTSLVETKKTKLV